MDRRILGWSAGTATKLSDAAPALDDAAEEEDVPSGVDLWGLTVPPIGDALRGLLLPSRST